MRTIIVSGVVAMLASLAGTPLLIRLLRSKGYGTTITIRFWIISGVCVGVGLGIFYASWMSP